MIKDLGGHCKKILKYFSGKLIIKDVHKDDQKVETCSWGLLSKAIKDDKKDNQKVDHKDDQQVETCSWG